MFDYLSFNNEKVLLITPSSLKNKIREEIMSYNKLLNIKIMSIDEIKNRLFFEPLDKTFTTLYYKYKKPLSIINTLINYLYYIDINKDYTNEKINDLKKIKLDLLLNNLVKIDLRFIQNLKQYKIKLLGFSIIDKETKYIVNELIKFNDVEILNYYQNIYTPSLVHLHTIEEEINYVCYSISKLLEQGVDINNIKLCNINDEYTLYLKRIFKNYNIPLNLKEKISLYSLPLSLEFLSLLKENSKENTISLLKEKHSDYLDYINMYINLLNKYSYLDNIDLDLLKYELKNTYIKNKKKSNSIEVIDINEIGNSNCHIFIISCNYNYFPKILKDEDYLLDFEKDILNISTSKDKNKNNIELILTLIHSSEHLYLSYKDVSYFNEYHKVDFLSNIKETTFNKNILESFSINEDRILLAKFLDNNLFNNDTLILNNNYDINYLEYDYSFKGIDLELINNLYTSKPLSISYSSLNTYYECPFKYYLSNILKLDKYQDTMYIVIGKIMHSVIENCFNSNFNFEKDFEYYKNFHIGNIIFKDSELFFINNIKSRTLDVVNYLKTHEEYTLLTKHHYEKEVKYNCNINGHNIIIRGYIDKIIYQEINNVLYAAIIDLKTGSDYIDPSRFEFGLGLQLPFYTYLLKHDNNFNKSKILGLYIHNILNKINDNDTLKYNGYTLNDSFLLPILDKTYEKSLLIKNLKVNKDGSFSTHSKLINQEDLDNLPPLVEFKIKEMVNNIYQGKFEIKPKFIDKDDVSCSYCKFFAICYKTKKDYTYLKSKKGGSSNA